MEVDLDVSDSLEFGAGQERSRLLVHNRHDLNTALVIDGAPAWLYTRDGQDDVWEIGRERRQEHPTEKPTELARRAIENSTQEGEVVLDIFAGSGGTLIAAQQTGRRARGIELDPGYAAETLERLSEMGLSPILEDSDGSQEAEG